LAQTFLEDDSFEMLGITNPETQHHMTPQTYHVSQKFHDT